MSNDTNRLTRATSPVVRAATFVSLLSAAAIVAPAALADDAYSLAFSPEQVQTEAGMQELHNRIKTVARASCPGYGPDRGLARMRQCRTGVAEDLINKVNIPAFTAYVERSGQAVPAGLVAVAERR